MNQQIKKTKVNRKGAASVMIMILTALLFVAICFSIDIARIQLAQLELQCAADLSARAGAEAMSRRVGNSNNLAETEAAIKTEIDMIASLNRVAGKSVQLDLASQVSFGAATPNPTTGKFNTNESNSLQAATNFVSVNPQLESFPVMFGAFVDQESVGLGQNASAMIKERDIVVVLDKSTSMCDNRDAGMIDATAYDFSVREVHEAIGNIDSTFVEVGGQLELTRAQALKLAMLEFRKAIDKSRGLEQLGLVAYSNGSDISTQGVEALGKVTMNNNGIPRGQLQKIIDDQPRNFASSLEAASDDYKNFDVNYLSLFNSGGTNIVAGIEEGTNILFGAGHRQFAKPVLIVLTDGNHNQGDSTPDVMAAACKAAHPNMQIYTVTFGLGANQGQMQLTAAAGGGEHYHANDVFDLVEVFEDLANSAGVSLIK